MQYMKYHGIVIEVISNGYMVKVIPLHYSKRAESKATFNTFEEACDYARNLLKTPEIIRAEYEEFHAERAAAKFSGNTTTGENENGNESES